MASLGTEVKLMTLNSRPVCCLRPSPTGTTPTLMQQGVPSDKSAMILIVHRRRLRPRPSVHGRRTTRLPVSKRPQVPTPRPSLHLYPNPKQLTPLIPTHTITRPTATILRFQPRPIPLSRTTALPPMQVFPRQLTRHHRIVPPRLLHLLLFLHRLIRLTLPPILRHLPLPHLPSIRRIILPHLLPMAMLRIPQRYHGRITAATPRRQARRRWAALASTTFPRAT